MNDTTPDSTRRVHGAPAGHASGPHGPVVPLRRSPWLAPRVLMFAGAAFLAGCGSDPPVAVTKSVVTSTVRLTLADNPVEVRQETFARAEAIDEFGQPFPSGAPEFLSASETIATIHPTSGRILPIAPGTTEIIATIDGTSARQTITVFTSPVRINEVEPDGDGPGGWVEFVNPTASEVDVSGWLLTSSDIFQSFALPAGSTIPAGGFLVVAEADFPAGIKAADAVQAFSRFRVQVDAFLWTVDPGTSFGRCPDGTGEFVTTAAPTPGSANACPAIASGPRAPLATGGPR